MINLYSKNEINFDGFGIKVLKPIMCTSRKVLNGLYTLKLKLNYEGNELIERGQIIRCNGQLYRIKRIEKKGSTREYIYITGELLFQYRILDVLKTTFIYSDKSCDFILGELLDGTLFNVNGCDDLGLGTLSEFDKNGAFLYKLLCDIYGGELSFELLNVSMKTRVGSDRGVRISRGKNLLSIEHIEDDANVVTQLHYSSKDSRFTGVLNSQYSGLYEHPKAAFREFEGETQEEVNQNAANWLSENEEFYCSYTMSMADLENSIEYKDRKQLEAIDIGDTITIVHSKFEINIKARILDIERNEITGKIIKAVIGNYQKNYFVTQIKAQESISRIKSTVDYAIVNKRLNSATLKGVKIVDEENDKVTFEITENGSLVIDISANADFTALKNNSEVQVAALQTSIQVNTEGIDLKVSKASVISQINLSEENIKIAGSKIDIAGVVVFTDFDSAVQEQINQGISALNKVSDWQYTGTTEIDGRNVRTGSLVADTINGGVLKGITIEIDTDAVVGDNICLGNPGGNHIDLTNENGNFYLARNNNKVLKFYSDALWVDGGIALREGSVLGTMSGITSNSWSSSLKFNYNSVEFYKKALVRSMEVSGEAIFNSYVTFNGYSKFTRDVNMYYQDLFNVEEISSRYFTPRYKTTVSDPASISVSGTAGTEYTYTEKKMLNDLKSDMGNMRSKLYDLINVLQNLNLIASRNKK